VSWGGGTARTYLQPSAPVLGLVPEVNHTYAVWEANYALMNEHGLSGAPPFDEEPPLPPSVSQFSASAPRGETWQKSRLHAATADKSGQEQHRARAVGFSVVPASFCTACQLHGACRVARYQ